MYLSYGKKMSGFRGKYSLFVYFAIFLALSLLIFNPAFSSGEEDSIAKENEQRQSDKSLMSRPIALVIAVDTSVTMGDLPSDATNSRLDIVKPALKKVVSLISSYSSFRESRTNFGKNKVGVVSFEKEVNIQSDLSSDHENVNRELDELKAGTFRNLGGAIESSLKLFEDENEEMRKCILMVCAGGRTAGIQAEEIISRLIPAAEKAGVSFGITFFHDEDLSAKDMEIFEKLSKQNLGNFEHVKESSKVESVIMKSFLSLIGKTQEETGVIPQGEEKKVVTLRTDESVSETHILLQSATGDLRPQLRVGDPEDKELDIRNDANCGYYEIEDLTYVVLANPSKGEWKVELTGKADTPYNLMAADRKPSEEPIAAGKDGKKAIIILFAILGAGIIAAVFYMSFRERTASWQADRVLSRGASEELNCPSCKNALERDWNRCPYCLYDFSASEFPSQGRPAALRASFQQVADVSQQPAMVENQSPGLPLVVPPVEPAQDINGVSPQARSEAGYHEGSRYGIQEESAACILDVIEGEGAGGYYAIDTDIVTIGRAPDNHIVLQDETVSAYHARLYWFEEGFFIEDLNSTNGTYVNGQSVATAWLVNSSQITIGSTTFQLGMPGGEYFG